jgi:uncharacterized lipoprotein YmbA
MKLAMLISAVLLAGCSTTPKWLQNTAACSLDGQQAYVVSHWGPVALASPLEPTAAICKTPALSPR